LKAGRAEELTLRIQELRIQEMKLSGFPKF